MAKVTLENLTKKFGETVAVDSINLEIKDKEFIVLVGPSGCGKTTTLRMIAGLEKVSEGKIFIDEELVNDLHPGDRNIAMVFQNYALYPHMTVFENLSFGPRVRKAPVQQIEKEVTQAAKLLGIENLLDRLPKQLSGGERQRVALGRAIIRQPRAFLFDEPLSNLDAKLRLMMRGELLRLHQQFEITTIYVTHDQIEAMTMGDRVVVMKDGSIQQIGTPVEIYRKPANKFVAGFIGSPSINFVNARLEAESSSLWLIADDFRFEIPQSHKSKYEKFAGKTVVFGIRPDDLYVAMDDSKILLTAEAKVEVVEFVGSTVILEAATSSHKFVIVVDSDSNVKVSQAIEIFFDINKMCLFDSESERLID